MARLVFTWWRLDLWRGPWHYSTTRHRRNRSAYQSDVEYSCLCSEVHKHIPLDGGSLESLDEEALDKRGYKTDYSRRPPRGGRSS